MDIVFYLAIAYAAWLMYPGQLRPLAVPILALIGGGSSTSWSRASSSGVKRAITRGAQGLGPRPVPRSSCCSVGSASLIPIAIAVGVVAQTEVLAITVTLRGWQHDVHSLWHALAIRRAMGEHRTAVIHHPALDRSRRGTAGARACRRSEMTITATPAIHSAVDPRCVSQPIRASLSVT